MEWWFAPAHERHPTAVSAANRVEVYIREADRVPSGAVEISPERGRAGVARAGVVSP